MWRYSLLLAITFIIIGGCQGAGEQTPLEPPTNPLQDDYIFPPRTGCYGELSTVTFEKIYPEHFFRVNGTDYTNMVDFVLQILIIREGEPQLDESDIQVWFDGSEWFDYWLEGDHTTLNVAIPADTPTGPHTILVEVFNGSPLGANFYWDFYKDPIPPEIVDVLLDHDSGIIWVAFDKPIIDLPNLESGTYITINGQSDLTEGDEISPMNINLRTTHIGGVPESYYESGMEVGFDLDPRGPTTYVVYTPKRHGDSDPIPHDCSCTMNFSVLGVHHFQETEWNAVCYNVDCEPNEHCDILLRWDIFDVQRPRNADPEDVGWGIIDDPYDTYQWEDIGHYNMRIENCCDRGHRFDSTYNIHFIVSFWMDCNDQDYEGSRFETLKAGPIEWTWDDMDIDQPWYYHYPEILLGNEAADRVVEICNEMSEMGQVKIQKPLWQIIKELRDAPCNWYMVGSAADWYGGSDENPGDMDKKRSLEWLVSGFLESKWYERDLSVTEYFISQPDSPIMTLAYRARLDFFPICTDEFVQGWPCGELKNDGAFWNEGEMHIVDITGYYKSCIDRLKGMPGYEDADFELQDLRFRIEDWMPSRNPDPDLAPLEPINGNWHRSQNLVEGIDIENPPYLVFDYGSPYVWFSDPTWHFVEFPKYENGDPKGVKGWFGFTLNCPCYLTVYLDDYEELPDSPYSWAEDSQGVDFRGQGFDEWEDFVITSDIDYDKDGDPDLTPIYASVHDDTDPLNEDYPGYENNVFAWDGCGAKDDYKHPEKDILWNDVRIIENLEFTLNHVGHHFTIEWDGRQMVYVVPGTPNEVVTPMYIPPGSYHVKYVAVDPHSSKPHGIVQKSVNPCDIDVTYPSAAILFPDNTFYIHEIIYSNPDHQRMRDLLENHGICYGESHGVRTYHPPGEPFHKAYSYPYSDHFNKGPYPGYGGFYPHNYYTFTPYHSIFIYFGHHTIFKTLLGISNLEKRYLSFQTNTFDLVYLRTCHSWLDRDNFEFNIFVGWPPSTLCGHGCMKWSAYFITELDDYKTFYAAEYIADQKLKYDPECLTPEDCQDKYPKCQFGYIDYKKEIYKNWTIDNLQKCSD